MCIRNNLIGVSQINGHNLSLSYKFIPFNTSAVLAVGRKIIRIMAQVVSLLPTAEGQIYHRATLDDVLRHPILDTNLKLSLCLVNLLS
jgi:hypothetical protein